MTTVPRVSIIIPLHVNGDRFRSDLARFERLDYPDYEILLVTDRPVDIAAPRLRTILTGRGKRRHR
jgi:hypothetical protein